MMDNGVQPKLLDIVKTELRTRHYSLRTEKVYIGWIKKFILFNNKQHPSNPGTIQIRSFINHLAEVKKVSASTQNQALQSIFFLYKEILKQETGWIEEIKRVTRVKLIPVVFSRDEAKNVLRNMKGISRLIASLLYGSGLRLNECLRLRIKDIDFDYSQIIIRDGKGEKDRRSTLPESLRDELKLHIKRVKEIHQEDIKKGLGKAPLPYALSLKYSNAGREFGWQFLFPSDNFYYDDKNNLRYRYHIHSSTIYPVR
jgi:integron integrase